ncbi:helix-turn-helix transcriptional regulator [Sneathiella aquimaris]|uniref:helix-turn-helix transcriptional regulator n=1 Tax=Sneathiella aquimaris TaxID=2599305 RepID=UPI00146A4DCC|nr:helix-turn-helix transcriptional regulator [Sneathiella aquimaris]
MDVFEVISKIYDAAVDPCDWSAALGGVCDFTGSNGFNIFVLDHLSGTVPFTTSFGIPESLLAEYNAYYVGVDPGIQYFVRNPTQPFYYNYLHTGEKEMAGHEYYDWLENAGGAKYYLARTFKQDDRFSVIATSQRSAKVGHAQAEDFEKLALVGPHIQKAVRINQLFKSVDLRMAAAYDALERLPYGVFLLSEEASVLYMNERAKQAIGERDGLIFSGGRLKAFDPRDDRLLQFTIKQNLSMVDAPTAPNPGYVQISRQKSLHPYTMQVLSLIPSYRLFSKGQPSCIVILSDPSSRLRVRHEALAEIYGLTPTEARIASVLAAGIRPADICQQEGISDNTLRTHRKRILSKIGVETQAQLVQILNAL